MNFTTFDQRIGELEGFDGFSPRMTLLGKLRTSYEAPIQRNTSAVLMIIVKYYISNLLK